MEALLAGMTLNPVDVVMLVDCLPNRQGNSKKLNRLVMKIVISPFSSSADSLILWPMAGFARWGELWLLET